MARLEFVSLIVLSIYSIYVDLAASLITKKKCKLKWLQRKPGLGPRSLRKSASGSVTKASFLKSEGLQGKAFEAPENYSTLWRYVKDGLVKLLTKSKRWLSCVCTRCSIVADYGMRFSKALDS